MAKKAVPRKPEPKSSTEEGRTLIQVRVPADLLEAIDAESERLSKAREGEPVSRSEAVRILVRRGLAASQK
jgi:metal-responsive CopG/Arc/MetJ family transcriptional regulator